MLIVQQQGWSAMRTIVILGLVSLFTDISSEMVYPLIPQIVPQEQRGTMMGLHATLTGIGLWPASLIAGFLWSSFGPTLAGMAGLPAAMGLWILN